MQNQKENPSYYAIIPATVRYDKTLNPFARLLYGEITALSQKTGFCWSTNGYFSEIYGVAKETISRWINQLAKKNYIFVEIIRDKETKQVKERKIYINDCPKNQEVLTEMILPLDANVKTPIDANVKENNTSINNTSNNIINNTTRENIELITKYNRETSFNRPTIDDIRTYMRELSIYSDAEPARFFDYYESNGWHVGKQKMKDWKAAVRNWKRNLEKYGKTDPTQQPTETPKLQELTPSEKLELRRKQIKELEAKNG